jgi:hypothetical protein
MKSTGCFSPIGGNRDLNYRADIEMGLLRLPNALKASFALALCAVFAPSCARSNVRTAPGFTGAELQKQRLLILPVAVTDDFGDERTGIVLDHQSREEAAALACRSALDIRDDIRVVCFNDPSIAGSGSALRDVSIQFARDASVPAERWRDIARATGARFALLFRPEKVSAHQKVTPQPPELDLTRALYGPDHKDRPGEVDPRGSVKTSRTYTLSSELVDLGSGRIVRVGARSGEASTSSQEAPKASLHLHDIMRHLMSDLLDED